MNETEVTVAGNVATRIDYRTSASGAPVVRFRLASTARRFDREQGSWTDGDTSFYTVWAWRALADNVASSVARGEPVLVRGRLRIVEEEREGRRYLSADLLASTVGHDLSRGTAAFARSARAIPELTEPVARRFGPPGAADPWTVRTLPPKAAGPGGPRGPGGATRAGASGEGREGVPEGERGDAVEVVAGVAAGAVAGKGGHAAE